MIRFEDIYWMIAKYEKFDIKLNTCHKLYMVEFLYNLRKSTVCAFSAFLWFMNTYDNMFWNNNCALGMSNIFHSTRADPPPFGPSSHKFHHTLDPCDCLPSGQPFFVAHVFVVDDWPAPWQVATKNSGPSAAKPLGRVTGVWPEPGSWAAKMSTKCQPNDDL